MANRWQFGKVQLTRMIKAGQFLGGVPPNPRVHAVLQQQQNNGRPWIDRGDYYIGDQKAKSSKRQKGC